MAKTTNPLKVPPQDLESEMSVLGALMLDKNAIIKIADLLKPQDFYQPANQKIYETILGLFEKGQPIDILTIKSKLKEKKLLKEVGGEGYLTSLIENVPTSAHIEHYANSVREKRVRRDLINVSSEINEKAFEHDDFETLLDQVEQRVFDIAGRSHIQKFVHLKDDLPAAYERLEKLHRGEGGLRGVPTYFTGIDNILSGLQKSDLIIIGARPSFGKTSFVLDIAREASLKGHTVGIFSLEMSREQVIDRIIASHAQIPLWRLRTGRLSSETEFTFVQQALDDLSKNPLFIDDSPSPNILQMRSMARRLQLERGLDLLIVDYLQLVQPRISRDNNMVQQITEVSRGLKALAKELNIPVLAVSQLSRAVDQREIKIPRLSDLRESGSLEQDADVVMLLYRKDRDRMDASEEEQNLVEVIIAKHRNGPLGSVQLKFDQDKVSFRNIDTTHQAPEE